MKKILFLSILTLSFSVPAQQKVSERNYQISIPEHLINNYWQVIHQNTDEMSVKNYREIMQLLEQQILSQSKQFQIQDSLNNKKDSLKTKK